VVILFPILLDCSIGTLKVTWENFSIASILGTQPEEKRLLPTLKIATDDETLKYFDN
jgi:hypothetical protein